MHFQNFAHYCALSLWFVSISCLSCHTLFSYEWTMTYWHFTSSILRLIENGFIKILHGITPSICIEFTRNESNWLYKFFCERKIIHASTVLYRLSDLFSFSLSCSILDSKDSIHFSSAMPFGCVCIHTRAYSHWRQTKKPCIFQLIVSSKSNGGCVSTIINCFILFIIIIILVE